jgi:integrase
MQVASVPQVADARSPKRANLGTLVMFAPPRAYTTLVPYPTRGGMRMTVPSAHTAWKLYHEDLALGRLGKRRRQKTLDSYQFVLCDFWVFVAPIPWHGITPGDLDRYLDRRARQGGPRPGSPLSPNSRALYSGIILTFYQWSTRRKLLKRNPLEGIRPEPKVEPPPRGLDVTQVGELLAATAPNPRTHLAVALGFFALLRAGEIARLRIEDVDLRAGVLVIHGKGGHVDAVPVHFRLRPILARALEGRPPTGPVIEHATQPGRQVSSRTVSRMIAQPMRKLGWSESAHVLRHSAAYLILEATGNVYAVSRLLRHRRLSSTERYVRRADRRLAADLASLPDPRQSQPREVGR